MEDFIEQIVACNPPKNAGFTKAMWILFCVVSLVVWGMHPLVGLLTTVACIIATVLVFRQMDYEWEYDLIEGELDVDKIICKSSRKRQGSFDFKRVEVVAPVDSQEALRLEHGDYKTYSFVSNTEDAKVYVAYPMLENAVVRVYFEPNEALLNALEKVAPRKVIRG